jgi:glyoxylase-like metal-dependent hydrolase (beta-lactamase superfamily II)
MSTETSTAMHGAIRARNGEFPRVRLDVLRVGHCTHPECVAVRGGAWRIAEFPALVGLIRHADSGAILFDTGYAAHFADATARFPERLYRWTTPFSLPAEQCLQAQLARHGLALHEIRAVFASHLHGDHIAGLRDLPRATIWCGGDALRHVRDTGRLQLLRRGYLPGLLPDDFERRYRRIEDHAMRTLPARWAILGKGYDLIGDGSLWGVPLPGHARGHFGLLLRHDDDREWLLAGDAAWHLDELRDNRPAALPTRLLVDDWTAHRDTRARLHRVLADAQRAGDDGIAMLPAHCDRSYRALPVSMREADSVAVESDHVISPAVESPAVENDRTGTRA